MLFDDDDYDGYYTMFPPPSRIELNQWNFWYYSKSKQTWPSFVLTNGEAFWISDRYKDTSSKMCVSIQLIGYV